MGEGRRGGDRRVLSIGQQCGATDHERECEAVEGAIGGVVEAVSASPELDQAHQGGEAGVNVSKVAQHRGLEPGSAACHADITLHACTTLL